ncbi:3'(2'),5'-bisphosphate nucleotidase CysQ [Halobacillus halophilus]|uniref:3'(2'),5'-bisphosphate nucleotidase CysQ n=1 Tax=Halobacillus halophilus (strain ATCC 35676 / DSM 2266 / JCM 20832 / KCTC 3685 / LMG 17431 / NBRC 102448 / NCIMB 2269) TaxID=866895 RepID=I0JRJ0_HALH3|nr:3'(2'),5'-bisphosphate nucleotidase CysQ [Halobacillus halophilus]ASF40734.1 3'(2'),5'-bisphosphate nucleotidase CysQ [Halobacillus halophilus]CCG46761.1 3'(2'),5'-bisphosphate nucleotidase [Halobacillus halophilus DSM 2266]
MQKVVVQAAIEAGNEIMKIYETDFDVEYKEDESPLTIADQRSHEIIKAALQEHYPEIPILSEEGSQLSYDERKEWKQFWLVDPIDGTKEFIKKNGEFTVNIALIRDGKPVLGVVYAPALDDLYVADEEKGAYKVTGVLSGGNVPANTTKLPLEDSNSKIAKVVASRSHMSKETEEFINQLKESYEEVETISAGSSLKLCLVAEGKADYYPRYAPTMEWDTGAGQAVVELSGGRVEIANGKTSLTYNKEILRNPWFLAHRS